MSTTPQCSRRRALVAPAGGVGVSGRHRAMPVTDAGQINWDRMAREYQQYVLSPFDPQMLDGDRNPLVGDLRRAAGPGSRPGPQEIADFGCGPGLLIDSLVGLDVAVTGVDLSGVSLEVARGRAHRAGVAFEAVCSDLTTVDLGRTFDAVVSSNSVLPHRRSDVVAILESVSRHLSGQGLAYFILPSFDTTEYLMELLAQEVLSGGGSRADADRLVQEMAVAKKVDRARLMYADDGRTQQCYHTPRSIAEEFAAAGLSLVQDPQKVYYPWSLTREFDYGYFPGAPEEIWDWYVIAERAV